LDFWGTRVVCGGRARERGLERTSGELALT
jgi:hypothetical protein